jgi:hypothetical protein
VSQLITPPLKQYEQKFNVVKKVLWLFERFAKSHVGIGLDQKMEGIPSLFFGFNHNQPVTL